MSWRWVSLVSAALAVLLLSPAVPIAAAEMTACQYERIAVDTSFANAESPCLLGNSVGQTFVASDTLIRSISVWRLSAQAYAPAKLWLVGTDPTGWPDFISRLLLSGPILRLPADSLHRYVKLTWAFDPPFSLPGPGLYAFFVNDACLLQVVIMRNRSDDPYPAGHFWRTYRGCPIDYAPGYRPEEARSDLIFEIEFCDTNSTPVRARSWGELKVLYR